MPSSLVLLYLAACLDVVVIRQTGLKGQSLSTMQRNMTTDGCPPSQQMPLDCSLKCTGHKVTVRSGTTLDKSTARLLPGDTVREPARMETYPVSPWIAMER